VIIDGVFMIIWPVHAVRSALETLSFRPVLIVAFDEAGPIFPSKLACVYLTPGQNINRRYEKQPITLILLPWFKLEVVQHKTELTEFKLEVVHPTKGRVSENSIQVITAHMLCALPPSHTDIKLIG
jgi:hypothetical protein